MQDFPIPRHLGVNTTRWPLSSLLHYEANRDGKCPPTLSPEQERYLTVREVAARYAVGITTVWRWAREATDAEKVAA